MRLTIACGRYDRTQALVDGRVRPEGVEELTYLALRPGETYRSETVFKFGAK